MSTQKVGILAIKADEQSAELIHPGEGAFNDEALPVKLRVEQTLTPTLGGLAVALVLGDGGDKAMIEAHFPRIAGIEGAVGIEQRPGNAQLQPFQLFEGRLKIALQTKGVMVIARHQIRRGDHKAIAIGDGQDIARLGAFAWLVGHTLTAFLGNGMAAIQVQLRQIERGADRLEAGLPNLSETPVSTPFLEVVIDGLPTDLFFSGSLPSAATGRCLH